MSTGALLMMVITEVVITFVTVRFFISVLTVKPKEGE